MCPSKVNLSQVLQAEDSKEDSCYQRGNVGLFYDCSTYSFVSRPLLVLNLLLRPQSISHSVSQDYGAFAPTTDGFGVQDGYTLHRIQARATPKT